MDARAESTDPGLNWVRLPGAEQCIGWRELAERVEARLGRALFERPARADLSLDGYISPRVGGGFTARLAVVDPGGRVLGERKLETREASCRALDDSVVLVIAVTLDPDSRLLDAGIPLSPEVSERLDRLFREEPEELEAPQLTTTTPAHDDPARARQRRAPVHSADADAPTREGSQDSAVEPRWALTAIGVGEAMWLQESTGGLAARLWLRLGSWALALDGHWLAPTHVRAPGGEPGRLTVAPAGATLAACLGTRLGFADAQACPGIRVDAIGLEAEGFVADGGTRSDAWVSARLGAIVQLPGSGPWFVEAGLHLLVPLVTHHYKFLDNSGAERTLLDAGMLGGRLEVGVGFRP